MFRKFLAMIPHEKRYRSMWMNFLQSIALLAVAMVSALYSSSAGRDGRMIATAISALIALVISVWVGIRFVPRLALGVDWHWLPFLSHYKITQEGWIYFGAIAIVILAAINTSNNLLYMVLSALLAVLLLSGFLSALNFRLMSFDIRVPATCFAGQPFPFYLQIKNEKQMFPTFSLHTEPLKDGAMRFEPFYFPYVPAGAQTAQLGEAALGRRGRYQVKALRISSRYPFGFFSKGRDFEVASECVCFPTIIPHEQMDLAVLDIQGSNQQFERGIGFDLYMIRDYIQSDSARHVHWKASAKTASLKTREYAAEEGDRVVLGFDRFGTPSDHDEFERQVSYAASLAFYFIRDGVEVAFVSDDWRTTYGASSTSLDSILTYLAEVEPSPHALIPDVDIDSGALMLSLRGVRKP